MAKILVVDDSKFMAKTLKRALEGGGHEVVGMGSDGVEGYELFQSKRPDLTLLDITMPNRDGRDCLFDIMQRDKDARVIMISAIKEQDVVDDCLACGAKNFIQKPLNFIDKDSAEEFFSIINTALN